MMDGFISFLTDIQKGIPPEIYFWLVSLMTIPVVVIISWIVSIPLVHLARIFLRDTSLKARRIRDFLQAGRPPFMMLIALGLYVLLFEFMETAALPGANHVPIYRLLVIFAIFWLIYRMIRYVTNLFEEELSEHTGLEYRQREVRTRFIILRRVLLISTVVIGLSVMLMQFDGVRELGVSVLTSAGIAGIVLGLAAQKSIGSMIAGIQLAITQPVRIGDQVIVEGEWGTVEEIHLTYIVVRIWDLRRLVLPIARFLEQPFENWTRTDPRLLGHIVFYLDYSAPVDLFREELRRLAEKSERWDRDVCSLQVIDADERTMKLRALLSAPSASVAWDLRCEVREGLLAFAASLHNGKHLPIIRFEEDRAPGYES